MMLPKLHIELERWKYLSEFDVYISSFGNFKDREGNKLSVTSKGNYLVFRGKLVHRLVAATFNPAPGWGTLTVDHLDHNTRNNKISNLEWVTKEENITRAVEDEKANVPIQQPKDVVAGKEILFNGAKVSLDIAKAIMWNSKNLEKCKDRINKICNKIANGGDGETIFIIGDFTIEIIKE